MASSTNKTNSSSMSSTNPHHQIMIPMTRVRTIMKSSPEITNINQDTLYMVCKATEMFIKSFAREASKGSKTLDYQNLADIVANDEKFQFLNEIVPYKVKAKDALKAIETENKKSLIK